MDYTQRIFSPSHIISILKKNNLSCTSKFGQNLLINRDIAERILKYSALKKEDSVLEIGPGLGPLTFMIAKRTKCVIACEVDRGFARLLKKKADDLEYRNISVINKDFLKLQKKDIAGPLFPNKVISNFPYSIGIKAILKIIDEFQIIERITGTVQEELAERITSKPGRKSYSWVSVYLQYKAHIQHIEKHISPQNFFPVPEVYSSIINIEPLNRDSSVEDKFFKTIVKSGFSSRRKNLVNNLSSLNMNIGKEKLAIIIFELFQNKKVRAEELTVKDFVKLSQVLVQFSHKLINREVH